MCTFVLPAASRSLHPYIVKLGKTGEVFFTRLYRQFTAEAQVSGKDILGFNTNGGLFMVAGGSVSKVDEASGDIVKSFSLAGASTGSVTAVPASSDFLLLPYGTPAQPRVFDVDGNVIQLQFANPAYRGRAISMVINPNDNQQVYVATENSIALMRLIRSALADNNAGFNPNTTTTMRKTTTRTTTKVAPTTTVTSTVARTTVAATTSAAAPAPVATTTTVPSAGFRMEVTSVLYALLAMLAAMLAL